MNRISPTVPEAGFGIDPVANAFDAPYGIVKMNAATGALPMQGLALLTYASGAGAYTLATPVAGLPSAGGNDGQILKVLVVSAEAHTITTAADIINGADDTVTFDGSALDAITLLAYSGKWYVLFNLNGTLSEV